MSYFGGVQPLAPNKKLDIAAEQTLVEQCRRQDIEAFSKIVDAYQIRVLGFVRRMVPDHEEALDVTQEVFIRAFQNLGRFDGRCSLRTWMFRVAHNLCIDRARRAKRAPVETSLDAGFESGEQIEFSDERWNPAQMAMNSELQVEVGRAIASMSDKLRIVLLLHDSEDMGYDEIASTIDIPVGTVKSRLFLARRHLQEQLSQYLEREKSR